ncbi:MAG: SpoIID/LytB domain-containing protein [Actinomycetota bacterium]
MRKLVMIVAACAVLAPSPAPASSPERLVLEPGPSTIITVEGYYPTVPDVCSAKQPKPLRAKYRGRLELVRKGNRIRIINRLSFSHYLRGLAEVPASWPEAALRAQAIAARSYALHAVRRGAAGAAARDYDICATDQCQVYRGAAIELGAFGERWVDAVESTRGRVLTYGGSVIQAFYFSTSDGWTRRSFPGGTPQPWLPSVEGEDADAPLATWTASILLDDLAGILRARDLWQFGSIARVTRSGDKVRILGPQGSRSLSAAGFRAAINAEAPCLFPDRYPGIGSARKTKLPQTVPSTVFTARTSGGSVILRGRGWGHGVGMSQWGARSLADRGATETAILKHFYGPARVAKGSEPKVIRVLAAEDLRRVRLSVDGPFRVTTETGSELAASTQFEIVGGDALTIRRGTGPSLAPVLELRTQTESLSGEPGAQTSIPFEISRPARIRIVLAGATTDAPQTSFEAGSAEVLLTLPDKPGTYQAYVEADDGLDRVRSPSITLVVAAPAPPAPPPPPSRALPILTAVLLAFTVGAGAAFVRRRARARRIA